MILQQRDLFLELQRSPYGRLRAERVDVSLCDSDDAPTVFRQVRRFSSIAFLIAMPVRPVYFKSNPARSQQKVHAIPSDARLLDKRDTTALQLHTDRRLQAILAMMSSIAGHRTVLAATALHLPRYHSERLSTMTTLNDERRTAAQFGTVLPDTTLAPKSFPASRAGLERSFGPTAFDGAHRIAVRIRFPHSKGLTADWTDFADCWWRPVRKIALPSTKTPNPLSGPFGVPIRDSTAFTDRICINASRSVIALRRTVFRFIATGREWFVTPETLCQHNSIVTCHSLKHGLAMSGKRVALGASFPGGGPPLHVKCRCTTTLVVAAIGAKRRVA